METIVLKAMEKNPIDRYGTAQELADDLRRWLEDLPIQARRPTWGQVARKWAARHKILVRAGRWRSWCWQSFSWLVSTAILWEAWQDALQANGEKDNALRKAIRAQG